MTCRKGHKLTALIPDEAGIIRAEEVPASPDFFTIGDVRKLLFDSALYVEQCAREYIDNPPPGADRAYIDAMQSLIETGEILRALIDDEEINRLPVSLAGKIYCLAVGALFIGRMEQLASVAPILSKEQLIRELYAVTRENHAADMKDRAEIKDMIDQKEKAAKRQPKLKQKEAALALLRAEGKKRPTETEVESEKRKIRSWEAFTKGKGGNKPPEGYPGLTVSVLEFSQWAMHAKLDKDSARALHNLCTIQKDPGTMDEQVMRHELEGLAASASIDQVKKALEVFES